jgi:hypothetical protein
MLNRFLHPKSHELIHLVVLVLFTIGIVCSKAFMSIAIFLGLLNLLLEGSYRSLISELRQSIWFWMISVLFLFHLIGLLWTSNYLEGLDDLRMKTSLITVPLIVFSKPDLIHKYKNRLLNLLLITICIISAINLMVFFQVFGKREYLDLRELSLFGSHIRFGILVAFGVAIALYNVILSDKKIYWISIFLLIFYTFFSQVFSGLISTFIVLLVFALFQLKKKNLRGLSWFSIGFVFLLIGSILIYVFKIPDEKKDLKVNSTELSKCWKIKSRIDFGGKDKKGQPIETTLIRYMHSKNLSADSSGFQQLSESDIKEVEKGTADIREKSLFVGKLNELRFQIHEANNPNGSTIRQRIEYWKTGIEIIKENVFIGVGTGDVKDEFQKKYIENKSSLLPENRLETHNTYLTFFITFGLFGIGYLIYFLFKTYFFLLKHRDVLGVIFIILISASFLTEDTLETQMGITIFSFLFSLFSIKKPKENSSGSCLVE